MLHKKSNEFGLNLNIEEIPTPSIVIDLDILEENIRKMAQYCRSVKCNLRPHAKAHKNPFVARKQIEAGAVGLCCQTLEEVEALVLGGVNSEILFTNMVSTKTAIERLLTLCKNGDVMITLDSLENGENLARAARHRGLVLDFILEVNVGQNRTGSEPGEEAASLAFELSRTEGLRFRGLMGYEGHLQTSIPEFDKRKKEVHSALSKLQKSIEEARKLGLDPEIVTAGGSGTYNITAEVPGVTEIQPGSYIVMDARYNLIDTLGRDFKNSLFLISSVVSTRGDDRVIIDMGWKACSLEYQIIGYDGMPKAVGYDPGEITYSPGGDEHGILKIAQGVEASRRPKLGDRIKFIPSHCDTTVNLYSKFYGVRKKGEVEIVCPIARR